jgi:hypothetical protein
METFLEFLREVLKGVVREIGAYFFRKNILENKKTTLRRRKLKGGSQLRIKYLLTTTTLTVEVAGRGVLPTLLSFYYMNIIQENILFEKNQDQARGACQSDRATKMGASV